MSQSITQVFKALGMDNFAYFLSCVCSFLKAMHRYTLDAVTSSGILKAKQKLGRTFDSDKLGGIAFTKISKLTMSSS